MLLVIAVVGGYAIHVMTPEERKKALRSLEDRFWQANDAAVKLRAQDEPFRAVLKARTPMPIAVPAILAINLLAFTAMLFSSGSFGDPAFLVGWGASVGPRTSNGEWWRLAASLFVHAGLFHMLIVAAGLAQAGITLERMLGPLAIAVVYLSAGVFAGIERLSAQPMETHAGGTNAVLGIYGLLAATLLWNVLQRKLGAASTTAQPESIVPAQDGLNLRGALTPLESYEAVETAPEASADPVAPPVMIPLKTLARMAPAAGLFGLYVLGSGFGRPELTALLAGFIFGLVFARRVNEQPAPVMHVAAGFAAALVIVVASAAMLRGIADVRPEIARVVALESSTAGTYEKAVVQFRNGAMTAQALEKIITQKIVPELQQAQARLKAVSGVPAEHKPLVDNAEEYLRLRDESWRLRADALRKSNMVALRAADRSERASLMALERIRPVPAEPSAEAATAAANANAVK
jgi:membrane associated rhomboid family serine protease